jgi:hypothetical protein
MRTSLVIIPTLALLLLLAGCSGNTNQNKPTDPFIGGNIALNLYLQNGMPPPTIYDGGKYPFGVNIVLENVGEADLGPGTENPYVTARLENILPAIFGITDADLHQVLGERVNGRKKNFDGSTLGGMVANFVFADLNFQGKLQGNDQVTIRGTVCYDYSNTATTQICMKADMLENVQDSTLCSLTGEKVVYNSGGPIHVTKVIQNPLGNNKAQINFEISHVGTGEFYGRSATEDCNPSVRNTNKYYVDLNVSVQDPNGRVTCYRLNNGQSGRIVMYGGTPQIISCTIEHIGTTSARVYSDILTIRTFYRYGQFVEQPILIQSVPS